MELEQLLKLINTVSDSELTEFKYETENVCIKMGKGGGKETSGPAFAVQPAQVQPAFVPQMQTQGMTVQMQPALEAGQAAEQAAGSMAEAKEKSGAEAAGNLVKSPLVGTFYAAPSEDAEPFVKVGDTVKKGQVLAIVEAMKLMNEIESEYDGTVAEVLVENAQGVEYGQPLFRIK